MRRLLLGVALLVVAATGIQAAPLFTVTNNTGLNLANPPFTLGFSFTANQSGFIDALGLFDGGQNGLVESHAIGIYNSGGTLLASTTIPAGVGGTLINQFRYAPITRVNLTAGEQYTIGALYTTGNDDLLFPGFTTGFTTIPGITFNDARFAAGGALQFPGVSGGGDPAYFGPNAIFQVPEPMSMALFGGLVAVGGVVARRGMKVKA